MPIYRLLQNVPMGPEEIASIPRAFGSHRQFLADGGGRIPDLIDGLLQHFPGHAELPCPVLDLVGFLHVDFAAVLRPSARQITHPSPPAQLRERRPFADRAFAVAKAATPQTEEETRLSLCRSYDGFASRAQSKRSGCRLRAGSIEKPAQQGSGCFLDGTRLSLTGYSCRKGGSTCSAVE